MVDDGPASYSDLCIAPDGTICCLHERGAPGGMSFYSGDVVLARCDIAPRFGLWLREAVAVSVYTTA